MLTRKTARNKRCSKCLVSKPIVEFHRNRARPDGYQYMCKMCSNRLRLDAYYDDPIVRERMLRQRAEYTKRRRDENQAYVREHLEKHPCVDCGEARLACLDFDHLADKIKGIGSMLAGNVSLEKLKLEIAKCEVRCSNCHRVRTHNQFGWKYAIEENSASNSG